MTALMHEMMAECRYDGSSSMRKYFGVYFKCTRVGNNFRWYAEGKRVSEETVIKCTGVYSEKI